jgi:hypothetical protein
MLHRQSVWFLGKYGRLAKFPASLFAAAACEKAITPQTGLSGAPLNRLNASFHDSP